MTLDELTFGGPYKIAELRFVKDGGGYHRETREPGSDVSDLPKDVQERITAEWTSELIKTWQTRSGDESLELEPTKPDLAVKIADLEARLVKLEGRIVASETEVSL